DEKDLKKLGIEEELNKLSKKTVTEGIIRPRLNEIFTVVGEEVKKSGFGGNIPAGIVLTGGGARTVGIIDSCKRTLSLPVRIGEPKGLAGLTEEISYPDYASSYGLILYGMKNASRETESSISFKGLGKVMGKLPVKGVFQKGVDFIKSFLP
ncbi:hypothetical protein ACFLZ1_05485, partial [Patescibacteria group bacterium]